MALEAKLNIGDGLEYDIIDCEYEFSQPTKDNHLTSGRSDGGIIKLILLSPDNSNMVFHEWMFDKTQHKSGSITFSAVKDAKTSKKTLKFENAYCIKLKEHFNKQNDNEMEMSITVSANTVKLGAEGSTIFTNDYIA